MDPTVLLVATERDKVINVRDVVTIRLGELAIIPNEACDAATVTVDGLIKLIQGG
jgi:hypothetical protein